MTYWMMLLAATVLFLTQTASKPIDLTARALPMRTIVQELSKQTGLKLKVDENMQGEPLILRLNHVPAKEAMDKIADVFAAEWVDHGDFVRLERSREKIAAIRKRLYEERVKSYKASIDELAKLDSDNGTFDAKAAEQTVLEYIDYVNKRKNGNSAALRRQRFLAESKFPSMRLAIRVLKQLDPAMLAGLPAYHKVVLSTSPNSMQLPLAGLDPQFVQDYLQEQELFKKAIGQLEKKIPENEWQLRGYLNPSQGRPAKIIIATMPRGAEQLLGLNLSLLNEKGESLASDFEQLGITLDKSWGSSEQRARLRSKATTEGFALGPISSEIAIHSSPGAQVRATSPAAIEAILQPTKNDPLSFATADIVLTAAERQGLNVICLAADTVEASALASARNGKTSLPLFVEMVGTGGSCKVQIDDRWLEIKPVDPEEAARSRVPRAALEGFLRSCRQLGYVSLESAAQLWGSLDRDGEPSLASIYAGCLIPPEDFGAVWAEPNAMRFFNGLTPQQRDVAASKGITLRLDDLSPDQLDALKGLVFEGNYNLTVRVENGVNVVPGEPTEMLPDGLPSDTTITVKDELRPVTYVTMEGPYGSSEYAEDPGNLAWALIASKSPRPEEQYRYTGFRVGQQRAVDLMVKLTPKITAQGKLTEDHRSKDRLMSADQLLRSLPDDVRQKIEAQMAQMQARTGQAPAPGPTSTTKPPRL